MSRQAYSHPCLQTHPACQQTLRGCRPALDHNPRMFLASISFFHLACGILLLATSLSTKEYKVRYDDQCFDSDHGIPNTIQVEFDNPEFSGNAYLYYELHGFYQSHFRFMSSFSANQFQGRYESSTDNCNPTNNDYFTSNDVKDSKFALSRFNDHDAIPCPCGLFPTYFFTDTYQILDPNSGFTDKRISWRHEIKNLFKLPNSRYSDKQRWMKSSSVLTSLSTSTNVDEAKASKMSDVFPGETLNEHFIVWMRTSHQPTFRKLYMKFNKTDNDLIGLPTTVPENLRVQVTCNYDKSVFDGERWLVLVKPNQMGGNNLVLAYINFALFVIVLLFSLTFCVFKENCVRRHSYPVNVADNDEIEELEGFD